MLTQSVGCTIVSSSKVGLHQNRGYDSLRVVRKGDRRDALAINPQTAARLRAYLARAGHGENTAGTNELASWYA